MKNNNIQIRKITLFALSIFTSLYLINQFFFITNNTTVLAIMALFAMGFYLLIFNLSFNFINEIYDRQFKKILNKHKKIPNLISSLALPSIFSGIIMISTFFYGAILENRYLSMVREGQTGYVAIQTFYQESVLKLLYLSPLILIILFFLVEIYNLKKIKKIQLKPLIFSLIWSIILFFYIVILISIGDAIFRII